MAKRNSNSKKGHSSGRNNKGKGKSGNSKPKGVCFSCGENGHWKRECPQRKKNNSNDNKGQENASSDAFVCHDSASNTWVLDSGTSDHMCHRREWFENFVEASSHITVGNGEKIMARGKGDINLLAFDGNQWICRRMYCMCRKFR